MIARGAPVRVALAVAAALAAAPASRAQCRLCETPTTAPRAESFAARIQVEVEADLDFDRLVVVDAGPGSAMLRPDGSRQVAGSVRAISGRAMVGEARVRGEPGRSVRIDMPSRIQLHSMTGAIILIDEIVTDLPPAPRLDSSGALSFRFGGSISVSGNVDGDFRGEVPITVEYL